MKPRLGFILLAVLTLSLASGCRHYGPRSIVEDRIPYNEAIARTWKEQTLLNIVKLRHMDTPFFVDVAQITSGYTLQGGASAGGGIFPPVNPVASFGQQLGANLNLQGAYQDRPTISYLPQTSSQFILNLTQPINPGSVLFLIQAGYPADVVFGLSVESINGINNQSISGGQLKPANPAFSQIARSVRKAQVSGHVGIRVEQDDGKADVAVVFHDENIDPELAVELAEVRRLLRVDPDLGEFRVVFGGTAAHPDEMAILSRSVLRVLSELAAYVDVPVEHLVDGSAPDIGQQWADDQPPLHVFSGPEKPRDPFVAVCYQGTWFWIDRSDFRSKRTFAYLLVLLAIADTGPREGLPVITIQAN